MPLDVLLSLSVCLLCTLQRHSFLSDHWLSYSYVNLWLHVFRLRCSECPFITSFLSLNILTFLWSLHVLILLAPCHCPGAGFELNLLCVHLWFLLLCICLLGKFRSLVIFTPQSLKAGEEAYSCGTEIHCKCVAATSLLSPKLLSLALASPL